ncbi:MULTISPECIES: hypothetical protein [Methylobacterium]|uniref:Uncharacterized protein n=1 Tax=Methylobacterium thuringiense TaxID=1003091 RepID=A0ABQ4TSX2_9HYPH|nr:MULTISPECIES: hypothetical protein [Methylobacterium]TXN22821.1 hypothetical protein FV217_09385 [Methylobacterium sp. WL9]GJE57023.1 hypothetical protein EKPJFOCH_3533 [Methylobacterium thuringiense]
MSRILAASALALSLVAGLPAAASAQSYNAPAGIPAVTAPGGLEGAAAVSNLQAYDGRSYQVRPGEVSVEGVYTTGSIRTPQAVRGRTAH